MLRTPGPGWLLRWICGGRPVVGAPDEELIAPPKMLPSAAFGVLAMTEAGAVMLATMGKPVDSVAVPENVNPSSVYFIHLLSVMICGCHSSVPTKRPRMSMSERP